VVIFFLGNSIPPLTDLDSLCLRCVLACAARARWTLAHTPLMMSYNYGSTLNVHTAEPAKQIYGG